MSVPANHDVIQRLINHRTETGYSSTRELKLAEHLQQLQVLYGHIKREFVRQGGPLYDLGRVLAGYLGTPETKPNPKYPEEDFEDFVLRAIRLKKRRIEVEIDVRGISDR